MSILEKRKKEINSLIKSITTLVLEKIPKEEFDIFPREAAGILIIKIKSDETKLREVARFIKEKGYKIELELQNNKILVKVSDSLKKEKTEEDTHIYLGSNSELEQKWPLPVPVKKPRDEQLPEKKIRRKSSNRWKNLHEANHQRFLEEEAINGNLISSFVEELNLLLLDIGEISTNSEKIYLKKPRVIQIKFKDTIEASNFSKKTLDKFSPRKYGLSVSIKITDDQIKKFLEDKKIFKEKIIEKKKPEKKKGGEADKKKKEKIIKNGGLEIRVKRDGPDEIIISISFKL